MKKKIQEKSLRTGPTPSIGFLNNEKSSKLVHPITSYELINIKN